MPIFTGTAGNDSLAGTSGDDTLVGLEGDDGLRGNGGNDTLDGGDGNDFLNGGNGDDFIDGGAGFDRAAYFQANPALGGISVSLLLQGGAQFVGSQGWDTLVNIEHVSGTPFADTITGDGGDNWLWGSTSWIAPDDRSLTNDDVIDGGDGNDLVQVGYGNHSLTGGIGNDSLRYTENGGVEVGLNISLALQGAAQSTGAGNWTLSGFENLSGGTLNDQLTGDGGDNILAGFIGGDTLVGGAGNDQLYGDGFIGVDTRPTGGSGLITLFTDATQFDPAYVDGDDLLEGGLGDDLLDGGGGNDTASYVNAAGGVQAFLYNGGSGEAFGADGYDQLLNIENLTGSSFNDILGGNNQDNFLSGGAGNDQLRGNAGNDTMLGGGGDDFLGNGAGDDVIDGGDGFDRVSHFTGATFGVTVDLRVQGVAQDTGQGMDTLIGIENVSGTLFADTLIGDDASNWLWGSPATLADGSIATTNNDTIFGGGGNDGIWVGIGNHVVDGGTGIDTLRFTENANNDPAVAISLALQGVAQVTGQGSWTISNIENLDGGTNHDFLTGDANANILAGRSGNDVLVGGSDNDLLYGDGATGIDANGDTYVVDIVTLGGISGNDTLEGGLGNDLIDGGGGIDTASYANASGGVNVNLFLNGNGNGSASGADGDDTLVGIENITGSAFNDILTGNNLANAIDGGEGNDSLRGRGGDDSLQGGGGNDFLNGGQGDDVVDGGAGFDRAAYFTDATAGVTVDLRIQGVAQDTGQGMDTLIGIEHVSGTLFGDVLTGNDGDNWIWGSPASPGDGSISAANNDVIDGQGGNDLIGVGIGNHSIDGGSGNDTLYFTENLGGDPAVTINLSLQGAAQVTGQGSWTITNVENLSGGTGNDALTGDGNANILGGFTGNDTLVGGAGNDQLYGDGFIATDNRPTGGSGPIGLFTDAALFDPFYVDGNDTLEGGLGDDLLDGGGGNDTASYANASGGVNVNLGNGTASGADGSDTLVSIENAIGSAFNDSITGSGGGNILDGLGGNDGITGGAGDDILDGGDGNDTLRGDFGDANITATGNDVIYGGNGNDFLGGGLGDDQLYGGTGNDLFRGNGGVDYFDGGPDDGLGNGFGDRVSFYDMRATQGVVADLRSGIISNDGFGNVETMVNIESLGSNTAFADTFYGNDGRNYLAGDRGDTVYAFGGDDLFQLTSAPALLDGGTGIDTASVFSDGGWLLPDTDGDGLAEVAAAATSGWIVNLTAGTMVDGHGNSGTIAGVENVNGSELGDTLIGDGNVNVLNGGFGDDLLEGGGDNDTLDGGAGNDTASYANAAGGVTANLAAGTATGGDGSDILAGIENLTGSSFSDVLTGNGDANVLVGGNGNDRLSGGVGNDNLQGGSGNDTQDGGDGDDMIDGGAGFDRASYNVGATAGVTVNLSLSGAQDTGRGMDTLVGIEHVVGTVFDDVLTGDAGDNWLWGGSLGTGVTGNDNISGGDGNDLIEVGTGNHSLSGGNGIDTLSFFGGGTDITSVGVTFSLASAAAQNSEQGTTTASGFENLSGSVHDDVFTGNAGNNVLAGNGGSDQLNGGDGNDILYGDGGFTTFAEGTTAGPIRLVQDVTTEFGGVGGNDVLDGGVGNDQLYGGTGNDTLNGGRNNDFLYGGTGNDVMSGGANADRFIIEGLSGADRIVDFAHVDRIVFDASSGADSFSDLIFTASGRNTIITWGTGDSLTVEGFRPRDLTAADFEFAAVSASMTANSTPENGMNSTGDYLFS